MKKNLLCILLFCISFAYSQQFQVTGSLKLNKETKQGTSVLLFQKEKDMLYKSAVTQNDGVFTFSAIESGTYILKIDVPEFESFRSDDIVVTTAPVNLPVIELGKRKVNELAEVTVQKRPLIQVLADKTVFNVQNTINATGNSGFDLLRKAPGIVIDNNDNLIVEGKTGVLIYIDGKQSYLTGSDLTNYLKTLQANDIDSIEIITQPSSKFDA